MVSFEECNKMNMDGTCEKFDSCEECEEERKYSLYEMIREIANTDDETLKGIFGMCELDDIILNHSLMQLESMWNNNNLAE